MTITALAESHPILGLICFVCAILVTAMILAAQELKDHESCKPEKKKDD